MGRSRVRLWDGAGPGYWMKHTERWGVGVGPVCAFCHLRCAFSLQMCFRCCPPPTGGCYHPHNPILPEGSAANSSSESESVGNFAFRGSNSSSGLRPDFPASGAVLGWAGWDGRGGYDEGEKDMLPASTGPTVEKTTRTRRSSLGVATARWTIGSLPSAPSCQQ